MDYFKQRIKEINSRLKDADKSEARELRHELEQLRMWSKPVRTLKRKGYVVSEDGEV